MKKTELNRNEQLYGPSPKCSEVIEAFNPEHLNRYIDGYYVSELRTKLGLEFDFPADQIILDCGAEGILTTIFNCIRKGDSLLTATPTFTFYQKYLSIRDIPLHAFDFKIHNSEYQYNVDNILHSYDQHKSNIVLISSPNNPTGNSISPDQLETILKHMSSNALLILDEAYYGFDSEYDQKGFLSLLSQYPNVMIIRSFSKLYGLAGLRIGFALCGTTVLKRLNWQHQYLGFSRILEEVAIAALDSKVYYKEVSDKIIRDRELFITEISKSKDFTPYASKANFVLVGFDKNNQSAVSAILSAEDSPIAKIVDDDLMRVTIGMTEQVRAFSDKLKNIQI